MISFHGDVGLYLIRKRWSCRMSTQQQSNLGMASACVAEWRLEIGERLCGQGRPFKLSIVVPGENPRTQARRL
jgi:hypothetical protein